MIAKTHCISVLALTTVVCLLSACSEASDVHAQTPSADSHAISGQLTAKKVVNEDLLFGLRGVEEVACAATLYGDASNLLGFNNQEVTRNLVEVMTAYGLKTLSPTEAGALASNDQARTPATIALDVTSGPSMPGVTIFSIDLKVIHMGFLCREPNSLVTVTTYHKEGLKAVPTSEAAAEIKQMLVELLTVLMNDLEKARQGK